MEVLRVNLSMEMEKTDKDSINVSVIDTNMSGTFAASRLEIVHSSPVVVHVLERWLALFLEHVKDSVNWVLRGRMIHG